MEVLRQTCRLALQLAVLLQVLLLHPLQLVVLRQVLLHSQEAPPCFQHCSQQPLLLSCL